MTGPFLSFRTDTMDPSKLEPVLSRYLKYERLRWFRSRLIPRLAVLLLACWALTAVLHVIPAVALETALFLVAATTAAGTSGGVPGETATRPGASRGDPLRIFMTFLCQSGVFKIQTPFVRCRTPS